MMASRILSEPSDRSVPDRFESFDVSIRRVGENYQARVTRSPVTGSPAALRQAVPIDAADLQLEESEAPGSTGPSRDVRRQPIDRDDLRRIGERLFRVVFTGAVAEVFRASLERVRNERAGLRICLHLEEVSELATLPWEALWDPTDRAFFADRPDLPIVRALGMADAGPTEPVVERPLRLLAVLPEPRGEGKLSGASEWRQIRDHLRPLVEQGVVSLDLLQPPTLDALGTRIDQEACHILHVVAHGGPGATGSSGVLMLEDATGGLDRVTGGDFARALERRSRPRLVILNACHGARAAVDDVFDGLAQHLVSRGVRAVVAMRSSISDAAAVSFAVALYQELASGRTIEAAMVEARRVLSLGENRAEWATPALYLHGDGVRIFDLEWPPVSADRLRIAIKRRRLAGWLAAVVAAGLLGGLFWFFAAERARFEETPSEEAVSAPQSDQAADPGPCSTPLGLQDLSFVRIDDGVVDLGERKVTVVESFCIGTKEVSRRDWQTVMGEVPGPSNWPAAWPVTHVTIDDARQFLDNLEVRDPGFVYRLPTAAEWEFAARADRATKYFFGDEPSQLDRYGNCFNVLGHDGVDGPAPVGSFKDNPWGLYDVHGNVAEWVRWPDYAGEPVNDKGQEMALRLGGSYDNSPGGCAFLEMPIPVRADIDDRRDTGFRVVREIRSDDRAAD